MNDWDVHSQVAKDFAIMMLGVIVGAGIAAAVLAVGRLVMEVLQ